MMWIDSGKIYAVSFLLALVILSRRDLTAAKAVSFAVSFSSSVEEPDPGAGGAVGAYLLL
jgi:hypothetical protein